MWNGLGADGQPVSITDADMARWAMDNDQHITVCWGCKKEFSPGEVKSGALKGARLVTLAPGEKTYEQAATRAGWLDMAERFKAAGL
jgi:hypothetical protein